LIARWPVATARLIGCVIFTLHGAVMCIVAFPRMPAAARMAYVGKFSRRMLAVLGIGVSVSGSAPQGGALLVSNHVSWLDILVMNAVHPTRFVSKSDVRAWPLLGWMVECGGTLFIERERPRDALRVVHLIAEALTSGDQVSVFPEGTTSDGRGVLPFHANLLQAAIVTKTPVQPLVLRYRDAMDSVSAAAAYIGDTTLIESLWAIVCARGLHADLRWLPDHPSANRERRLLAAELRDLIAVALDTLASH
jgi:1-acyl-sn-glycerol-3-phosphate acyltransferase